MLYLYKPLNLVNVSSRSSGSSDDSMNLNDIVRRLKEVIGLFGYLSLSQLLQNQWSRHSSGQDIEKTKPDNGLQFQFEKVKKLEGELATEQQRLKVIIFLMRITMTICMSDRQ